MKNPLNIVFVLMFSSPFLIGQPIRAEIPDEDYIHEGHSSLVFPASKEFSNVFFQKMANLMLFGEGKINVVHFGGSHIQADIYHQSPLI